MVGVVFQDVVNTSKSPQPYRRFSDFRNFRVNKSPSCFRSVKYRRRNHFWKKGAHDKKGLEQNTMLAKSKLHAV
ncbi:hypothetical protein CEXT_608911 [Caerostris extrusa]|uniref:Uncharacterized protein n=1 Tax=Caerostris extrusa TaxID=172846 RepID=A0AAV4XJ04_CAEEX|nr:hypothetical protein CEXT_608911 [Caerostris extrusa]